MHFEDRCAMCGLEVAKTKVADLGKNIDPAAVDMIKMTYVDDGSGGGTKETVDRLIGEETTDAKGNLIYSGTVNQIFALGGFSLKVMVRDRESLPDITEKLGGGVLGLSWDPLHDDISMHLAVNMSLKKANVRLGPELTESELHYIALIPLSKRIAVSQVNAIYDPLGLLAPLTIRYKLTLQKITSLSLGWDEVLQGEIDAELRKILTEMVTTPDIKFHRAVVPANARDDFELLGFWDGGKPASAAVIYTRHELEEPRGQETHSVRLLVAKARVTPTSPTVSTPRTELRGLLLLSRLITSILPGLSKPPSRISLFGDSQCTISAVECDQNILEVWFGNRVAEIRDHMQSWRGK